MRIRICYKTITFVISLISLGCSDFVDVNLPDNQITNQTVFKDDETAKAAITGLYIEMSQEAVLSNSSISILTGLSSDELLTFLPDYLQFQENDLTADNPRLLIDLWKPAYRFIYVTNSILEGINYPTSIVSLDVRRQLEGEARFIRAFAYFNLLNLYGKVPLTISTDLEQNDAIERSSVAEVYELINSDLSIAKDLLPTVYPTNGDSELRIRLTSWAALALQAKVYLYQERWAEAVNTTSLIINNGQNLFDLEENLERVFSKKSREAIWQIQPVIQGLGSWEANLFMPISGLPNFIISDRVLNSFERGDQRREAWIDSVDNGTIKPYHYSKKYKYPFSDDQYHTEFRYSEIILTQAEALANLGRLEEAIDNINLIRERAGLDNIPNNDVTLVEVQTALCRERLIEFLTEGQRWADLKRWGLVEQTLSNLEYKKWQDTDLLYPVPKSQIEQNTNLLPQNEGY